MARTSALAALVLLARCGTSLLAGGPRLLRRSAPPRAASLPHLQGILQTPSTQPQADEGQPRPRKNKGGRLNIRIDDNWYDLTLWRQAHPAGTHWIDAYNNSDATEVMYGFHSDAALNMVPRLPKDFQMKVQLRARTAAERPRWP